VRKRKVTKLAAVELFEYAVRILAARAASATELRRKLRVKAASLTDIEPTIARLEEIGYLNDARFSENFASNRVENDGFGRQRVLSDLRSRGVSSSLADQAVEQALAGRTEAELIDAYIERRMPSLAAAGPIEDQRTLARAFRRLRRAGYSAGASLAALKRLAARPEEIEEPADEPEEPEA
jgi:regulatory protein